MRAATAELEQRSAPTLGTRDRVSVFLTQTCAASSGPHTASRMQ